MGRGREIYREEGRERKGEMWVEEERYIERRGGRGREMGERRKEM